jgi:hypothetical protein
MIKYSAALSLCLYAIFLVLVVELLAGEQLFIEPFYMLLQLEQPTLQLPCLVPFRREERCSFIHPRLRPLSVT